MFVTAHNLLPLSLLIAPISMIMLAVALKQQLVWLTRLSLLGMAIAVLLLVAFQYRDFKHFEDYLLQGRGSEVILGASAAFKEALS